jgi:hypothetical protein
VTTQESTWYSSWCTLHGVLFVVYSSWCTLRGVLFVVYCLSRAIFVDG